jgi:malonyl-CoA/methylmalonyl-CoA synthetase
MTPDSTVSASNGKAWQRHLGADVSVDSLDLTVGGTLPRAWRERWEAAPNDPSLIHLVDGATYTRGDINLQTASIAAGLFRLGLRPGDRVLMSAASTPALVSLHVAALRLGAVVVPANTAYRERELAHIVRDCSPVMAVMDQEERATWVQAASPDTRIALVAPEEVTAMIDGGVSGDVPLDSAAPDDPALIVYTSGTTGAPKGATLSHGNLLASSESLRYAWRWDESDGLVLALPLFHVHGLCVGVHGCLLTGARILLLPRFESGLVIDACTREDATLLFGVPTMWVRLADAMAKDQGAAEALSSLRLLVSGSAPLPAVLWNAVREQTGKEILERYGMSETIMLISNPYDGPRLPGTVGLPLPGVEARIVTEGKEAPDGQIGEIQVRGPNVFSGYWNREDATRDAFVDDWFRTGDLATRDSAGYFTIAGRAKELIITGGYNVYPREVEEVLEEHPGLLEAAVVGIPSREWGEEVAAFLVPVARGAPPTEEELVAWCRERLAAYKLPRRYSYIDRVPRNALGKIVRGELKEM